MDEKRELGRVRIPGEGVPMRLSQQGGVFTIWVEDTELMSSDIHHSEDVLAKVVCGKLTHVPDATILIGGLGMGFTLAAALKELGPQGRVVVAELMRVVVDWNRGPLAHLAGCPLEDPRVEVRLQDVAMSLQTGLAEFDGILLDVDNGPEGLTRDSNNWLYSQEGLSVAYSALRPNGVLAVWSSTPDKTFAMRMRKAGFSVTETVVDPVAKDFPDRHVIFVGARGGE